MRITVLSVPGCPHAPVAVQRVTQALAGRRAVVESVEVTGPEQAARLGMTGSPTVLVDGTDPFASPGAAPSLSCRLYRDAGGPAEGAPSIAGLRRALDAADPAGRCEEPLWDAVSRGGQGRLAPEADGLRAVQQAVLRHFAATGSTPPAAVPAAAAAAHGRTGAAVLADLAAQDFLALDEHGRIRAAYPFSATPTAHHVRQADGTEVWAMCALDALGIPPMLRTDAVITSADPVTDEPVTVAFTGGVADWRPTAAVVYLGRRSCSGPAADTACGALNFFAGPRSARDWAGRHPEYTGTVLDQERAESLARSLFGPLLTGA